MTRNDRPIASLLSLAALIAALIASLAVSGCETEKQYPGGDNDDRRKPAAAAAVAAPPSAAAPGVSRDKPGSGDAGGK